MWSVRFLSPFTQLAQNLDLSYNNCHPLLPRSQEVLSKQILTLDHEALKQSETQFDYNKVTVCSLVKYVELYICTTTETEPEQTKITVIENSKFTEKGD